MPDAALAVRERRTGLALVGTDELFADPENPRKRMRDIEELARSIRENGLIQPPVVYHREEGGFTIFAGHRRHAAITMLGWPQIPVLIGKPRKRAAQLAGMLVENEQRDDLDPIEQAFAFRELKRKHGWTDTEIARRIGKSQAFVSARLSLVHIPAEHQEQVRAGELTISEAVEEGKQLSGKARPTARGKKSAQHFSIHHDLGPGVRKRCRAAGHKSKGAASVGGVGCGRCWEAEIRDDQAIRTAAQAIGEVLP